MPLASLEDINQHLPASTLQITELEDDPWQTDAERVIRGYLSNVYSAATLALWVAPNSTPPLIRSIAGRLVAAWFYASKVSGETTEFPEYARVKYTEAISFLEGIQSGDITVEGIAEVVTVGDHITSDDFYPNDLEDPAPRFTIAQEFG